MSPSDSPDTPEASSTMPTFDPSLRAGPPCSLLCAQCNAPIAHTSHIVSKAFRGHAGKAALFTVAKNIMLDPPSILLMDSGAYTIQEFICASCEAYLGWKFVRAHDGPERWKEGHFILELDLVVEEQDDGGEEERYAEGPRPSSLGRIEEETHVQMHTYTHKRTPSGTPPTPPPKGARQGRRSIFMGPSRKQAPRRIEVDDYDSGGPFWKPR